MQLTVILKRTVPAITNRVQLIKAVRSITGYGLKESKTICDQIHDPGSPEFTTFEYPIDASNPDAMSAWYAGVAEFNRDMPEAKIITSDEIGYYVPDLEEIYLTAELRGDFLIKTVIGNLLDMHKMSSKIKE